MQSRIVGQTRSPIQFEFVSSNVYDDIFSYVEEHGLAFPGEVSSHFKVNLSRVQRILRKLAKDGKIVRAIVLDKNNGGDMRLAYKSRQYVREELTR